MKYAVKVLGLVCSVLGLGSAGAAGKPVGQVEFVLGEVQVERAGGVVSLSRGASIYEGDHVQARASGMAHLRMIDRAFVSVRPNSSLRVQRYRVVALGDGEDAVQLDLTQGVFRSFTGDLGKRNPGAVKFMTPTATIGIRGTGNVTQLASDNSTLNYTITGSHSVTTANEEGIDFSVVTRAGEAVAVRAGQVPVFIPPPLSLMRVATRPPVSNDVAGTVLVGNAGTASDQSPTDGEEGGESESEGEGEGEVTISLSDAGASKPVVLPEVTFTPPTDPVGSVLLAGGSAVAAGKARPAVFGYFDVNVSQIETDELSRLKAVVAEALPDSGFGERGVWLRSAQAVQDAGLDIDTGVTWGRWGDVRLSTVAGSPLIRDQAVGSAHFVWVPQGLPTTMPTAGTFTYNTIGATAPTDQNGVAGTLTAASLRVNFSAMTANLSLSTDMGSARLGALAFGVPVLNGGFHASSADQSLLTNCTGTCGNVSSGLVSGRFLGAEAANAAMAYHLSTNRRVDGVSTPLTSASGVVVFAKP